MEDDKHHRPGYEGIAKGCKSAKADRGPLAKTWRQLTSYLPFNSVATDGMGFDLHLSSNLIPKAPARDRCPDSCD